MCQCTPPSVGSASTTAAHCVTDECLLHGKICTSAGQTCTDPNKAASSLGDWECRCVAPAVGSAVAQRVVTCEVDECVQFGDVCTNAGQTCLDSEKALTGY